MSSFKEPLVLRPLPNDGRFHPRPNPELPQIPAGTQFALIRSALLIDSELHRRATRFIESVQLRDDTGNYEFTLSRGRLFSGVAGGLRPVAADELDFSTDFNASSRGAFESDRDSAEIGFVRR